MTKNNQSILSSSIVLSSFFCLAMAGNCDDDPIAKRASHSAPVPSEAVFHSTEQPTDQPVATEAVQPSNSIPESSMLNSMVDTIQKCIVEVKKVERYLTNWKASHPTLLLGALDQSKPEDLETLHQLAQYLYNALYVQLDEAESCDKLADKVKSYVELANGATELEQGQIQQYAQEFDRLFIELKSTYDKVKEYVDTHIHLEEAGPSPGKDDLSAEGEVEAIEAAKGRVTELVDKIDKESKSVTSLYGKIQSGEEHYFSEVKARMVTFEEDLEPLKKQYARFNDLNGLKLSQIEEIENKLSALFPVIQDIFTKILENFKTRNDERAKKGLEEVVAKVEQEAKELDQMVSNFVSKYEKENIKARNDLGRLFVQDAEKLTAYTCNIIKDAKMVEDHGYGYTDLVSRCTVAKKSALKNFDKFVENYNGIRDRWCNQGVTVGLVSYTFRSQVDQCNK